MTNSCLLPIFHSQCPSLYENGLPAWTILANLLSFLFFPDHIHTKFHKCKGTSLPRPTMEDLCPCYVPIQHPDQRHQHKGVDYYGCWCSTNIWGIPKQGRWLQYICQTIRDKSNSTSQDYWPAWIRLQYLGWHNLLGNLIVVNSIFCTCSRFVTLLLWCDDVVNMYINCVCWSFSSWDST